MKKRALVSVVMPVYNQADYLPAAIDSVLSQTYPNIELILLNDGSTDRSPEIGREYAAKDSRVRFFEQKNRGLAAARNAAIEKAEGEFICLLDSDDCMLPEKVEKQVNALLQDPKLDITYTAITIIDQNDNVIGEMHDQAYPPELFLAQMFFRNVLPNPITIMTKSECLKENLFNEAYRIGEDYELILRLAHHYCFKYIDLPLTRYRRHTQNLSNNLIRAREAELKTLSHYSKEHVEGVVDKCFISNEEKTLLKGKIFYNMERFNDALAMFKKLSSGISLFYRGNCYLKLNQVDLAKQSFLESLQLDASNAACHNNLGAIYAMQKDFANSKKQFQKALGLRPGYLDPEMNLKNVNENPRITWRELRSSLMPYRG